MVISATSSATTATANASTSAATQDLTQNYTTFLKLLTTQLQNQDPLNPTDSAQFTNQLVQYSSVEQAIKQNKNLQTLIDAQAATNATNSVNYIGHSVAATSDQVALQNGTANINYALDSNVATNIITISDTSGHVLRALNADTGKGAHSITWDGNDANGKHLDDGVYKISIAAVNADKSQAGASIGISGMVTGVTLIDKKPTLAIGGVSVPLENVLSVSG